MKTFKHFLITEYNHDITWNKHGEKLNAAVARDYKMPYHGAQVIHKFKNTLYHEFKQADPTPHQEYSQWIASRYANGGIRHLEDIGSRTAEALELFHHHKIRKNLVKHDVNPDINSYKTLSDLETAVDKLPKPSVEDIKVQPHEFEKHEDEHWIHVIPKTEKAAQKYGMNTKWCTAANKNCAFSNYHYPEGHDYLHILIPKKPIYEGEKYQIHFSTDSIMNERDHPINTYKFFSQTRPAPESLRKHAKTYRDIHTNTYGFDGMDTVYSLLQK